MNPVAPADAYSFVLLALAVWREARGESTTAKLAVAWSIHNRAAHPKWWGGPSLSSVVLCHDQYSSFNPTDPNATKWPAETDPSWKDSLQAAELVWAQAVADPTGGATSYFSGDTVPTWAGAMTHTVDVGAFHFYRAV